MTNQEILQRVDHTQLAAVATWADIQKLCDEAITHATASVCIPPSYVKRANEYVQGKVKLCTVIGFPLGYSTTEVKVLEAKEAVADGACEIDMVVNLGDVKNKEFDKVTAEIAKMKEAIGENVLKVIVETCYLTEDEKVSLCKCVTEGGADFIKTSTGFGTDGAKLEDIELFKKHIGPNVKIKASGGIRSEEAFRAFINAGCHRIGTSSAIKILA
jgi:deoxyribose-phosphate aldolase